jgi:stage II sporulation protein E
MNTGAQAAEIVEKRKKARQFHHRWLSFKTLLDTFMHTARNPCLLAASTFFLSFSQCFQVPSPFAAAWVVTLGACGYSLIWPAVGCAAGLAMRAIWGIPLDIWQYVGCGLLLATSPLWIKRGDITLLFVTVLALLPRLIAASFSNIPGDLLLNGAGVLLGAVAAPAFRQGLGVLTSSRHTLSLDDKLCCLMFFMVLLTGTGYVEIFTVNIGQALAVTTVLCLAHAAGSATAVCGGLVSGTALAFSGQSPLSMVQLALGGLLAGLVIGRGKRWEVCALFLLADLLAIFLEKTAQPALGILTAIAGALLFLRMGEGLVFRVKALLIAAQPVRSGMENAFAAEQMRRWETAMDRMAQALPLSVKEEEPPLAERLAELLCKNCAEKHACWNERFAQTKAMMQMVLEQADLGEEALSQALTSLRGCGCIRLHVFKEAVDQAHKERHDQKAQEARARYEREMIRTHLTAMAQAVRRMAEATSGETVGDAKAVYDVSRVIRDIGFPGKLLFARQVEGHLQVAIEGESLSLTKWQPDKLLAALKEKAQLTMREAAVERGRLLIEEVPPFSLRIGSATLSAGQTEGGEHPVSGDAVLHERFPGGLFLLALSDGMGHGEQAHLESQKTLELLALCMAAGYSREQAITAVNGMMLSATGGDQFATVDLCVVDLWTGEVQIEKLGACTSYLKRRDHVKPIAGAALPLGILEQVRPIHQRIRLYDGDMLVLLSDGIQDAYPDSSALERAIDRNGYQDPQRMADALLRSALLSAGGAPKDDMTVLVVAVLGAKADQDREDAVQSMAEAV